MIEKYLKRLGLYDKTIDTYEGDIIEKNPMTQELIKLMMLNDENLRNFNKDTLPPDI